MAACCSGLTAATSRLRSPQRAPRIDHSSFQTQRKVLNSRVWPHLTFVNGRIFLRDISGNLKCLSLSGEEACPLTRLLRYSPGRPAPRR